DVLSVDTTPVVAPLHGTLNLNSDGSFLYTPNADYFGSDSFQYRVRDDKGGSDTAVVNIIVTAVNDAPTAVQDRVVLPNGQTQVTINVVDLLANDLKGPANESGQTLSITMVDATSNDGATVVYDEQAGTITYTANGPFDGRDTFTYTITDDGTTNGNADPKTSVGTVEVVDFVPSTLSGHVGAMIGSHLQGLGGVTVTLRNLSIFGDDITLTTVTNSQGHYEFADLPPGEVTITAEQAVALYDAGEVVGSQGGTADQVFGADVIRISLAEDTVGTGNDFYDLAIEPASFPVNWLWGSSTSILLNSSPGDGVLFVAEPNGPQHWYSLGSGWEEVVSGHFAIVSDTGGDTIHMTVELQNGDMLETSVPVYDPLKVTYSAVANSNSYLVEVAGGYNDFTWTPVLAQEPEYAGPDAVDAVFADYDTYL
ncbi:MAG: cadherin-like domain-containing protein, partial [Planctomycetales bacterium]|nr:cadherin-like domain-containing protein [Planctomycetales bacterium]